MKAVVLVSGGADSATCLAMAVFLHGAANVSALSVYYGQKHSKELEYASKLAAHYKVKHYMVDLAQVYQFSDCSLLKQSTEEIAHKSYAEQLAEKPGTVATYVPFRNGVMLSVAGALAMSIYPHELVELFCGAHSDDAAGSAYPDCSVEFVNSMQKALYEGSGSVLRLIAPFVELHKSDIIARGAKLGVPYNLTWSCYEGGAKHCGKCGTCIDRKKAFKLAGVVDPTEYEV